MNRTRLVAFLLVAALGWGACEHSAVATSRKACATHPNTPACVAKYGTTTTVSPSTVPPVPPTSPGSSVMSATTAPVTAPPSVAGATVRALPATGIGLNGADVAWTVGLLALVGLVLMVASHRKVER